MDVRGLAVALVDLVLPAECGGCTEPPAVGAWCAHCAERLGTPAWVTLPGGPAVLTAGRYTGPLRTALLRYKERGRRDLAAPLARHLLPVLDAVPSDRPGTAWLVPAPSRPAAARARGGDHVARLARALAADRVPTSASRRRSRSPAAPATRSVSTPRSAPPTSRGPFAYATQRYRRRDRE